MGETPRVPKGYLYCKECDIFYPEKCKREADAKRKKNEKKEIALRRLTNSILRDCPFCAFKEVTSLTSAVMSSLSSRRERFIDLSDMNRIRHRGRGGKGPKFIRFIKTTKK